MMDQYQEMLYWHIRRLVVSHEDAEDALQETFIRAYRSMDKFKGESKIATWLFRIATNEALRIIERRRQPTLSLDDTAGITQIAAPKADAGIDYGDRAALLLQKAILTLPTKQQLAFNMRYYDEMSFADIAEATGSTTASVKQNYHIAKDKIIKYVNSHEQ